MHIIYNYYFYCLFIRYECGLVGVLEILSPADDQTSTIIQKIAGQFLFAYNAWKKLKDKVLCSSEEVKKKINHIFYND